MHVSRLRELLGFSLSLLSSHLKVLRLAGIVDYEGEGTRHAYSLLAAAHIDVAEAGLTIHLVGDDGSTLIGTVPRTSPVMRVLASAIRAVRPDLFQVQLVPSATIGPAPSAPSVTPRPKRKTG
jgi:DNA-binding transcriptional ArsR family regulator